MIQGKYDLSTYKKNAKKISRKTASLSSRKLPHRKRLSSAILLSYSKVMVLRNVKPSMNPLVLLATRSMTLTMMLLHARPFKRKSAKILRKDTQLNKNVPNGLFRNVDKVKKT